jgi:hypothetical protein
VELELLGPQGEQGEVELELLGPQGAVELELLVPQGAVELDVMVVGKGILQGRVLRVGGWISVHVVLFVGECQRCRKET